MAAAVEVRRPDRVPSLVRIRLLGETPAWSWLWDVLAIALAVGFLTVVLQFVRVGHGGVDQNGYLGGARALTDSGLSMRYRPPRPSVDPGVANASLHAFVGRMWVSAGPDDNPGASFFPKYPPGLPALYAAILQTTGERAVYLVSPVASAVLLLACYAMTATIVPRFYALLAMLCLSCSPLVLTLANNPASHAVDAMLVTTGLAALLVWLRAGQPKRTLLLMLASLLLGLAVAVRYSSGLFVVPLVIGSALGWLRSRRVPRAGDWESKPTVPMSRPPLFSVPVIAATFAPWAVVVGGLLIYNELTLGQLTGYGATGEATSFGFQYAGPNWRTFIEHVAAYGLFLVVPIGIAGLLLLPARHAIIGWTLLAAVVPTVLLYTFYFWAPGEVATLRFLRFFAVILAPLAAAAFWLLAEPGQVGGIRRWQASIAAALLTLGSTTNGLQQAGERVVPDAIERTHLEVITRRLDAISPGPAVVFTAEPMAHHLQFARPGDAIYLNNSFDRSSVAGLQRLLASEAVKTIDQRYASQRIAALSRTSDAQYADRFARIMGAWHQSGRRLFFVLPADQTPADLHTRAGAGNLDRRPQASLLAVLPTPARTTIAGGTFDAVLLDNFSNSPSVLGVNVDRRRVTFSNRWVIVELVPR